MALTVNSDVVRDYGKLVRMLASKNAFRVPTMSVEDIEQEIWVALCAKAHGYDPARSGVTTFIWLVAASALSNLSAKSKRTLKTGKLPTFHSHDAAVGNGEILLPSVNDMTGSIYSDFMTDIAGLPNELQSVARSLIACDGRLVDAAEMLNMPARTVSRRRDALVEALGGAYDGAC